MWSVDAYGLVHLVLSVRSAFKPHHPTESFILARETHHLNDCIIDLFVDSALLVSFSLTNGEGIWSFHRRPPNSKSTCFFQQQKYPNNLSLL